MPYKIIHNHPDCPKESGATGKDQIGGHAVVKEDDNKLMGCHTSHESAEEQITALNIAESEQDNNYNNSDQNNLETREVDLSAPSFLVKNMKRGLSNLNKAGSGLTSKTIRDARNIVNNKKVSTNKLKLMYSWHSRHLTDLDREKSNPNDPSTWRGSDVAFLLWGSNPWTDPMQAGEWAKRKVEQLENEDRNYKNNDIKESLAQKTTNLLNSTYEKIMDNKTENRSFSLANVEVRKGEDDKTSYIFEGYASVFDKSYSVRDSKGAYNETIKPGAFKKTLKEQDDVRFLVNHDGIPIARSSSGTLELEEDDIGLFVKAELDPANPTVAEIASAMKRGDLNEMSFAFAAVRDDFDGEQREVQEVKLFDVSVVTYPANAWAGAKLRGVEIEEELKELIHARSGDKAIEVLEQIIEKNSDQNTDLESSKKRNNPKVELLKVKLKKDGLFNENVTPDS